MTTQPKTVAITGASGYIGAKLLEHLEDMPNRGRLIIFDRKPMTAPIHHVASYHPDLTAPPPDPENPAGLIGDTLTMHRATTLIHLAFAHRRDTPDASQRNRLMLENVLSSAQHAKINHLIYLSSHTVYGASRRNPIPISEDAPTPPAPRFPFANDHLQAETRLNQFTQQNPQIKLAIFRTAPVLGNLATIPLIREFYFHGKIGPSDHNPPLQFTYDDDLARILQQAITDQRTGTFNIASDGVIYLHELAHALNIRQFHLPAPLARLLNRISPSVQPIPNHRLPQWPALISTSRLRRATGYRFRHTAQDAVTAFARSILELQYDYLIGGEHFNTTKTL